MNMINYGENVPEENGGEDRSKVLILTSVIGGGTGTHILSLWKLMERRGFDVEIIVEEEEVVVKDPPGKIQSYFDNCGRFRRFPFTQITHLLRIRKYILHNPFDLLHTYFFWPIIYGRLLKFMKIVKVLVENREDEGFDWGGFEYFLLKLTRHIPDKIVCVSEGVKRVVMEKERVKESNLCVIRNGIEFAGVSNSEQEKLLFEEFPIPGESLVVGMVANLNRPVKGGGYFIEAVPLILEKVPGTHFIIVGGGDEIPGLIERTEAYGVSHAVHFVGFREDVEKYYEIMDISVLTSLSEGLSITLLEAMSHGLPVVVTEVGGNREVVVDGVTGYLVPPEDVPSFAEKVVYLLKNSNVRERMGERALDRIEGYFRIQDTSPLYEGIYKGALRATDRRKQIGGVGEKV